MRQAKSIEDLPIGTPIQLHTWLDSSQIESKTYSGIICQVWPKMVEILYSDGVKMTYHRDELDYNKIFIVEA